MSVPIDDRPPAPTTIFWLREGQRREAHGRLEEALGCYDRALTAADAEQVESSVIWMNRGSALQRFGDRGHTMAALAAYDEAIARQRRRFPASDPGPGISLAAALMNRGLLLHRLHGIAEAAAAIEAYAEAETVLHSLPFGSSTPPVSVGRNLGGIGVNRANLLLDLGQADAAAEAARRALVAVAPIERSDLAAAAVALMARRAQCDALGRLLVAPGADQEAIAAEASDAVDAALALARAWGAAGREIFAPLVTRLFRFGARLYRTHQPQFLGEFLFDQLDANDSPELRAIATETLAGALADLQRPQPFVVGTTATARLLATVRSLRAAQARLAGMKPNVPRTIAS
jgi:tetratricopeptide (TPR) repeat protein